VTPQRTGEENIELLAEPITLFMTNGKRIRLYNFFVRVFVRATDSMFE
jgi:hypothetical protein